MEGKQINLNGRRPSVFTSGFAPCTSKVIEGWNDVIGYDGPAMPDPCSK